MKTTTVARGFIGAVASLLGVVAVGCSADVMDQGAAGEGEIGVTSQALSTSNVASMPANQDRLGAASCKLSGNVIINNVSTPTDFKLVAGGEDDVGNQYRNGLLYEPLTNAWFGPFTFGAANTDEVSFAQMVPFPGESDSCLLSGGLHAGTPVATAWKGEVSLSGGVPIVTWTQQDSMKTARARFGMSACAGTKVIAVAGEGAGGDLDSIEVFDPAGTSPNKWTTISGSTAGTNKLTQVRRDFALIPDADGALNKFLVSGGLTGGSGLRSLETIRVSNACAMGDVTTFTASSGTQRLTVNREGAAGFSPATGSFRVLSGDDTVDTVPVTWNTSPTLPVIGTVAASHTFASGDVFYPKVTAAGTKYVVSGGTDGTDAIDFLEEFETSGTPAWQTPSALNFARVDHTAEYLPVVNRVIVSSGLDDSASPVTILNVESVTP